MTVLTSTEARPRPADARLPPGRSAGLDVWLLPVVLLLPTVPLYVDVASSLALGTTIASALLIVLAWFRGRRSKLGVAPLSAATLAVLVLLIVVVHSSLVSLRMPVDLGRAGASLVPLLLVLMGGHALSQLISGANGQAVDRAMRLTFYILCLVAIAGILGLAPPTTRPVTKPVFPFTEPSHFALAFVPLLMYRCVTTTTVRRLLLLASGLLIAVLLENLTLVAGCFLVAVVSLRLPLLMLALAAAALIATQIDLSYYVGRLDLSTENQNLSSLAFLQGWQMMGESWDRSGGWGLGFQQLGVRGTDVDAAQLVEVLARTPLNIFDGSFTASKLVSEFGLIGIGLLTGYLLLATVSVRALKRARGDSRIVFAHCVLVSYGLELGLRGSGYFTASVLLMIAALWLLSAQRPRERSWPHATPCRASAPQSAGQ